MNDIRVFANRAEAGRDLADVLSGKELKDPVVLALPRGGVPVALEIAHALRAPIDLILVRKIGVPWQPELAAGAVVDGGHPEVVLNEDVIKLTGMSHKSIDKQIAQKLKEIEKRQQIYLEDRPRAKIENRTAIIVDDGIATGATVRAALKSLRKQNPKKLILAVPVASPDTFKSLQSEVDEVICLQKPVEFVAIGRWYSNFDQVSDNEVVAMLAEENIKIPKIEPTN